MKMTLKALGALLTYPNAALREALPEIAAVLAEEGALGPAQRDAVEELVDGILRGDPLDTEESYVGLFDRGRFTSLNLFEHLHGESRDRGPAMVDLKLTYEKAGYRLAANQLPDYLPVLLEFLSTRPEKEALEVLSDCAPILRSLGEAMRDRESAYQAVFAALLAIAGQPGFSAKAGKKPIPDDAKTIDEEWMDSEVIFGPGAAGGCGTPDPKPSVVRFMPNVTQQGAAS